MCTLLPILKDWLTDPMGLDAETLGLALDHHGVDWTWRSLGAPSPFVEGAPIAMGAPVLLLEASGETHALTFEALGRVEVLDGVWVSERIVGALEGAYRGFWAFVPERGLDLIEFYSVSDVYGEFSNFAPYPIRVDGKTWPTSEHYFQAQKFRGTPHVEQIRRAKTPGIAARMGRERSRPLRRDWESAKRDVMRRALRAKFTQHADLRALLVGTRAARLVERTANDSYWGDGGDGSGHNWLGRLLMELRAELT